MTDEELKLLNAVEDIPDKRDFLWSEYVEWIGDKIKFPWRQLKLWNQYDQTDTYKACSCYWATYIFNGWQILECQKLEIEFEQENPRRKWQVFQAERWYPDMWASLQEMMSFFRKRKLIDWNLLCKTAQECKNAIKNWCGIYTWSAKCSWSKTSKAKQFVYDENWAKHCFAIVDYDDNWLRAINSFWEDWWDKGRFYIPDEDYKYLYSTYALVDHDDTGKIKEMKYNMEYNESIKLWITDWTRPDDKMSRKEWAVMCLRAYKMMK
jgi:hypothetical protein